MEPLQALERLEAALATITGWRVYRIGAYPDPPATVVGLPLLQREAMCAAWTSARFPVYAVEKLDDRSLERLLSPASSIADALESELADMAVVTDAQTGPPIPGEGGQYYPSFEYTVEMSL